DHARRQRNRLMEGEEVVQELNIATRGYGIGRGGCNHIIVSNRHRAAETRLQQEHLVGRSKRVRSARVPIKRVPLPRLGWNSNSGWICEEPRLDVEIDRRCARSAVAANDQYIRRIRETILVVIEPFKLNGPTGVRKIAKALNEHEAIHEGRV